MNSKYNLRLRSKDLVHSSTLNRIPYFGVGSALMAIKFGLDQAVSALVFGRVWTLSDYLIPGAGLNAAALAPDDLRFYLSMLAMALPFVFIGCILTLRRLRAANLPAPLVILFFVPIINLFFFMILCLVPSRRREVVADSSLLEPVSGSAESAAIATDADLSMAPPEDPQVSPLPIGVESTLRQVPEGSSKTHVMVPATDKSIMDMLSPPLEDLPLLLLTAAVPIPIGLALGSFAVYVLGNYGWGLFVALPFVVSIAAPLLYAYRKERSLKECCTSGLICMGFMCAALLVFRFEGAICLLMAAPLLLGITFLGAWIAYSMQFIREERLRVPKLLGCITILIPAVMVGEAASRPVSPLYAVTTSVEINAPPDRVWPNLIKFPDLPKPHELLFKVGVAYPVKAHIDGHGVGAVRHCVFSTGTFVEPITVWNAPKLLSFGVIAQAPPMYELSPYPDLHPPHMTKCLISKKGQFLLAALPNGRTLLSGTTWYQNNMGPGPYWRIWSDSIIHTIHLRVLDHVKSLSEQRLLTSVPGSNLK